jgi:hypothetical protein
MMGRKGLEGTSQWWDVSRTVYVEDGMMESDGSGRNDNDIGIT